ncbi:MAG: hypothetical protein IJ554_02875 [Paludibacteraceae bacterium]|nr:hypothetical protein [Paludibacteraceae bacterium]
MKTNYNTIMRSFIPSLEGRVWVGLFLLLALTSCKPKDLVFDHEATQFEPMANAILIELIAPVGTAVDDEIYIFGAFNGLDENTAVGAIEWQMEKAPASDKKWGIYLFPSDFKEGKTLADGFSFVSKKAGGERDIKGKPVTHTLTASVGSVNNVWADRWASYFSGDDKILHNGPVVYVLDESGFGKLTLYMYGDVNDLNGGWPGMSITGYETVNGIELAYFDMGEGNEGLNETLIFSDNGSDQLGDYGPVTFGSEPLYLHITAEGKVEELSMDGVVGHDGPVVYVLDGKDWGMNTTLYMWGDVNDLNGGWPGMTVTGTETIGEYTYLYFDLGEANVGLKESLILSNNGATQLGDFPGNDNLWTIGEDLYLYMGADGVVQITDPEHPGDMVWFDPKAAPKEEAVIDLYFHNATETLGDIQLYAWGNAEAFGGWPGQSFAAMDTTAILGLELIHTQITGFVGDTYHLIVNNGNGTQLDDYTVTAEEAKNEYYLKITDEGVSELSVVAKVRRK